MMRAKDAITEARTIQLKNFLFEKSGAGRSLKN